MTSLHPHPVYLEVEFAGLDCSVHGALNSDGSVEVFNVFVGDGTLDIASLVEGDEEFNVQLEEAARDGA